MLPNNHKVSLAHHTDGTLIIIFLLASNDCGLSEESFLFSAEIINGTHLYTNSLPAYLNKFTINRVIFVSKVI